MGEEGDLPTRVMDKKIENNPEYLEVSKEAWNEFGRQTSYVTRYLGFATPPFYYLLDGVNIVGCHQPEFEGEGPLFFLHRSYLEEAAL